MMSRNTLRSAAYLPRLVDQHARPVGERPSRCCPVCSMRTPSIARRRLVPHEPRSENACKIWGERLTRAMSDPLYVALPGGTNRTPTLQADPGARGAPSQV